MPDDNDWSRGSVDILRKAAVEEECVLGGPLELSGICIHR